MPPGGAGLYFFYISFKLSVQERAAFRIGEVCRGVTDFDNARVNDQGMVNCGTIQLVVEGNQANVGLVVTNLANFSLLKINLIWNL